MQARLTMTTARMKERPMRTGIGWLAVPLVLSSAMDAQTIGIRVAEGIQVDVETIPTQQCWVAESSDLVEWTRLAFVDHSTTVDRGPAASGSRFFRLDPLYGPLTWSVADDMPVARDQFTGGVIDGKLYVFGGNGDPDGRNLSRLDIYDLETGEWSRGTDYGFGIEELSSAVVGGRLYVFGGYADGPARINLCYDPGTDAWSETAPKPTQIQAATVIAWGDEILVLGGSRGDGLSPVTVVEAYDTVSDTWRTVTDLPDQAFMFGAGIHEDVLYLVGGVDAATFTAFNRVLRFDLADGSWLPELAGVLPRPILAPYSSASPVVNGKLVMAGGFTTKDGSFTADTESDLTRTDLVTIYDIASNTVGDNTPLPEAFGDHLFLLAEDRMYALGGKQGELGGSEMRSARMVFGTFGK